jgi:hypothetical protein
MAYEDLVFEGDTLAKKTVAADLTETSDFNAFLDLDEGAKAPILESSPISQP